jgi:thymidylate synthase ThyX
MQFKLYKIEGYEAAIMALRMSKDKYYSWEKAREVQQLVARVTNSQGFIINFAGYYIKNGLKGGDECVQRYNDDVAEFERLLGLTKNNAMGEFTHHTLMKYIDITFITEGLHRGAQDDLDAHAIAFNNRITRFSTRLAEIEDVQLSEWYQGKLLGFDDVIKEAQALGYIEDMPEDWLRDGERYVYTPFGYVHEKYAQVPAKNGLAKDVQRGGMPLGIASNALWKIDLASLRYVYHMRSKLTKSHPELKEGLEQIADQLEEYLPVFGEHFRMVFTDSKQWEHTNKVRTITSDEYLQFKTWQREKNFVKNCRQSAHNGI